jgi:hypothetical protein
MNVPSVDLASTGSNFDVATFDGVVAQPAHRLAATARANNSLLMLFSLFRRLVCLSPSIARHFSLLCPNVSALGTRHLWRVPSSALFNQIYVLKYYS